MIYLGVDFFGFTCLRFAQFELIGPMFFCKIWEVFQPLYLQVLFQSFCFPSGNSDHMNVRSFVIVVQCPEALFFVFYFLRLYSLEVSDLQKN